MANGRESVRAHPEHRQDQHPRSHKLKPGPLLPDEWATMQSHAELGAKKLARGQSPYLLMDAEIVLHHHERWDGNGSIRGTNGAEPFRSPPRLMDITDQYDVLSENVPTNPLSTSRRPSASSRRAMAALCRAISTRRYWWL